MEKFSAYRDPGTGIQPFLTPVPPLGSDILANATLPLRYLLAALRTLLVLVLTVLHLLVVEGVCLLLAPIPPLQRLIKHAFTFVFGRTILFLIGLAYISVEQVRKSCGKAIRGVEKWDPSSGDIIVSNWVSWIELLWIAIRFNPIFVLPVSEGVSAKAPSQPPAVITHTPGRRTGTGSANIQSPSRITSTRTPIVGFTQASLLSMICHTGNVPLISSSVPQVQTLESIRKAASMPIVVFPECTTSNGRGLLRFADTFLHNIPTNGCRLFIMCIRYDPPTSLAPTLSHSIPSSILNPLPHLFELTTSLVPLKMSVRLLSPSESPGTGNDEPTEEGPLAENCASLVAAIGKMKKTGLGWEDKANFLEFYHGKRK